MTYQQALDFIHGIPRFGKKPGLTRIQALLERMGNPQEKLRFVHVAGTNGKGSTSTMISYALREAGYRVGLYISPFVIEFRERMQIDNEMISEEELCQITGQVRAIWEDMNREGFPPSEFEVVVSIAFAFFARHQCDVVVLEVGMGGRLDSTNVITDSLVSVITSIGLDHTAYLGDTIEKIAGEKCGILKPNRICVTDPKQHPDALAVIMEHCAATNNRLIVPMNAEVHSMDIRGSVITFDGMELRIPLIGEHQIRNAMMAASACLALQDTAVPVSREQIAAGIAKAKFPSRMELFGNAPLIVMDGAHNEPGAQVLSKALELLADRTIHAVVSMSADKDAEGVLSLVLPHCKSVVVSAAQTNVKAADADGLDEVARKYCADHVRIENSREAFEAGYRRCGSDDVLLIFGSLYFTSELRPIVMERAGEARNHQ